MSETTETERDEALVDMTHEQLVRRVYELTDGDFAVMRYVYELQRRLRLRGEDDGGREEKQIQMEMLRRAYHSVMAAYLDREDYQKVLRGVQEGRTRAATHYHRRFSTPPSTDRSGAERPAPADWSEEYARGYDHGYKTGQRVTAVLGPREKDKPATPDPDDGDEGGERESAAFWLGVWHRATPGIDYTPSDAPHLPPGWATDWRRGWCDTDMIETHEGYAAMRERGKKALAPLDADHSEEADDG